MLKKPMLWWKAFHIISVISWMAGLLYLFRLFIYHNNETEELVKARFKVMELRLLRFITNPAAIATLVTGVAMVTLNPDYLRQSWMQMKLVLVFLMFGVHGMGAAIRKKLLITPKPYNDKMLRFLNEVPTLLMIGIVLLVVLKP